MLQVEEVEKVFLKSYSLQTSVGDLSSAAEGFDALVRSRRGTPYTAATTNVEASRSENVGTGDGGDDHGVRSVAPDALEAFVEQHEGTVLEFTARAASNFDYAGSEVSSSASCVRRNHQRFCRFRRRQSGPVQRLELVLHELSCGSRPRVFEALTLR